MKIEFEKYNNRISYCLVYIDSISKDITDLIEENLIDIVYGKLESERIKTVSIREKKECMSEAAKYIYKKKFPTHKVGIVAELLFHAILREDRFKKKFISTSPTIGYSDCYQGFYKGFDGCYYSDGFIWLAEVKSKMQTSDIDCDNEEKVKRASQQLENEARDKTVNRWIKSKMNVYSQLTVKERNDMDIFNLFSSKKQKEYNQLIGTLIINDKGNFSHKYIESYIENLYHKNVTNQKIFLICIRSFDYEQIINYIKKNMG